MEFDLKPTTQVSLVLRSHLSGVCEYILHDCAQSPYRERCVHSFGQHHYAHVFGQIKLNIGSLLNFQE